MRLSFLLTGMFFICSICVSGCGGPEQTPVKVTGVVYYYDQPEVSAGSDPDAVTSRVGKPISNAKVTFYDQGVAIGYGITDGLGRFQIQTYHQVAEPVDGLPIGMYAVTVTKLSLIEEESPSDRRPPPKAGQAEQIVPARYSDPGTTEWKSIEVKSGIGNSKNHFRLMVSSQE